jgi:hypothetical protein
MGSRPSFEKHPLEARSGASRRPAWIALAPALVIGVCAPAAWAQETPKAAAAAPLQKPDITTRYRFIEQYDVGAGVPPAGTLGTYRVAFKTTNKESEDQPNNRAPLLTQSSIQMIYTERAAGLATFDSQMVTDVIRHFDTVRITPEPPAESKAARPSHPLEGMMLWIRPKPTAVAEVFNLSPERPLKVYDFMLAGTPIWLPSLVNLLPNTNLSAPPKKVGESWPLVGTAARALLGVQVGTGALKAKLEEVIPNAKAGGDWTAVISVAGQVQAGPTEASVNARILFTFAPPTAPRTAEGAASDVPENVVEAHGAITEIRMSTVNSMPLENPRLRLTNRREFVLQRQIRYDGPPLEVPNPAPKPTEENSWLTYTDPQGAFQLRFGQELLLNLETSDPPNKLVLESERSEGMKRASIYVFGAKEKFQPETLSKDLLTNLEKRGFEITRGAAGWLPEPDWPGMKVYHFDAAATAVNGTRSQLYGYYVHMGQNPWFFVDGGTTVDPPTPFRKEVEGIIRSIKLNPKK